MGDDTARHRVLIIGGGFGGLYTAKALKHAPVQLNLLDRRNFHLFQPLLYQLATGSLSAGDIASPLRSVLAKRKNVRVTLGEARDFDLERRKVITREGELGYDTLIVAAGSETNYFGHEDWRDRAVGLKSVEEALEIRRRIFNAFEQAEKTNDAQERLTWLTFVVVGAGPTGVELAGALAEIANDTLKHQFSSIDPAQSRIFLVDAVDRPLTSYSPSLSEDVERDLFRLGVRFRSDVMVTGLEGETVQLKPKSGPIETLHAHTVIWAAGVKGNPLGLALANRAGIRATKRGQVPVKPDCSIEGHPEVFVIGDLAAMSDEHGKPLPGVAQVAMQQGSYVARLIEARLRGETASKPFHYWDKGNLATIGRNRAVAEIGKLKFHGFFAWLLWLFVHLMYLVQYTSRIVIFVQWGIQYLTFNRSSRLILQTDDFAGLQVGRRKSEPPQPRAAAD